MPDKLETDVAPAHFYALKGSQGSPYSVKMRAVLRYRRIPHTWEGGGAGYRAAAGLKARVIPVLILPDGSAKNDSTRLIALLEDLHPGDRSLVPDDPASAFLALLIEDFADEWLSKAMYGWRWTRPIDQQTMSRWLAYDVMRGGGAQAMTEMGAGFRDRQVDRRAIVGCGDDAQPLIEASALRIMAGLDAQVADRPYLFGGRPSAAEFALYGQISQFAVDPTPQALMRSTYSWLYRWALLMDDLSGEPIGDWDARADLDAPGLRVLLDECGSHHLPFLAANAAAVAEGRDRFEYEIEGVTLAQPSDRYQARCLAALRAAWTGLADDAQASLTPVLERTGCLKILADRDRREDVAA